MVDKNILLRNGRGFLLAYDQGLEHGPTDFNDENVDPGNIVKIAKAPGVFTGVIFQKGTAEKYYTTSNSNWGNQATKDLPPLIVKLNGKTNFHKDEEPYSPPLCTVEEAVKMRAKAIGYTIFVGSGYEAQMMKEFSVLEKEAHEKGLVVVGWMYPRGRNVTDPASKENTAYAARIGMELGCDFVKVHYTGDPESFAWVVKSAGRAGVFAVGGAKSGEAEFLQYTKDVIKAGAVGLAVGRNIWQDQNPIELGRKVAEVIWT